MKLVFRKNPSGYRKAFTLIEVTIALIVLGMIASTVLVIINRAMDTVVLWQNKMQAFEIARENMEKILSLPTVTDTIEYGISETNPDITWESAVESFYEPVTGNMWMRAVCNAKFVDNEGQEQKIELIEWLTSLNRDQMMSILDQKEREGRYQASVIEDLPETEPEQEIDPNVAWREMEKLAGPPPKGYKNWGEVPQEEFWNAVMKFTSEKK